MFEEEKEEYYENLRYRELLLTQPENFYLHLPIQIPPLKWLFELRLQLILTLRMSHNYFAARHRLEPQAQWFSDWIFLNHYQFDYIGKKNWNPNLTDKFRYQWLMRQGYMKEMLSYFELRDRYKEKKVTVKERKFLKNYEQCIYWFYFDSVRDDDLAFYRMGLDADQSLDNEDKPLFPNIAYSDGGDPRLAYFIGGAMFTESIPAAESWWTRRKAKKAMIKKWNKDEKVTYADMRVMFNPETTKIHDLEFLLHCYGAYGGTPKEEAEKKLFEKIYISYQHELSHIAQMMHMPELDGLTVAKKRKELNPLYIAYKKRWFYRNPVKEFEKVFHGVTYEEYQEIVNMQYEALEKVRRKTKKKRADRKVLKELDRAIVGLGEHK